MGQYRLQISFGLRIGFLISFEPGFSLIIDIPFIHVYIGLTEHAVGIDIFGSDR